jgi:hypothetical protein
MYHLVDIPWLLVDMFLHLVDMLCQPTDKLFDADTMYRYFDILPDTDKILYHPVHMQ